MHIESRSSSACFQEGIEASRRHYSAINYGHRKAQPPTTNFSLYKHHTLHPHTSHTTFNWSSHPSERKHYNNLQWLALRWFVLSSCAWWWLHLWSLRHPLRVLRSKLGLPPAWAISSGAVPLPGAAAPVSKDWSAQPQLQLTAKMLASAWKQLLAKSKASTQATLLPSLPCAAPAFPTRSAPPLTVLGKFCSSNNVTVFLFFKI